MRRLLLLRHAKSSHKDHSLADFDRPLAKRGRRDCRLMGEWMKAQGLAPDLIISSPAKRARQTARRICKSLDYEAKQIQWEDSIYDANARAVLKLLTEVPEGVETLLLVGHHLALESMILRMSRWADIPADPKLIPTCAIAWLEFDDDWSNIKKCSAKLQSITRPRVLAEEGSRLSA